MIRRAAILMLAFATLVSAGGIAGAEMRGAAALACCSSSCPVPARSSRDAAQCCAVAPIAQASAPAETVLPRPIVKWHAAATLFAILPAALGPVSAMIVRGESPPGESPSPARLCSFQI